jgi:hypothetical protein
VLGDPEKKRDGWGVLQYVQSVFLISSAIVMSSLELIILVEYTQTDSADAKCQPDTTSARIVALTGKSCAHIHLYSRM